MVQALKTIQEVDDRIYKNTWTTGREWVEPSYEGFGFVYVLVSKFENKVYVGQTSQPNFSSRWSWFVHSHRQPPSYLDSTATRYLRKNGLDSVYYKPFAICMNQKEMDLIEDVVVQYLHRNNMAINYIEGGLNTEKRRALRDQSRMKDQFKKRVELPTPSNISECDLAEAGLILSKYAELNLKTKYTKELKYPVIQYLTNNNKFQKRDEECCF